MEKFNSKIAKSLRWLTLVTIVACLTLTSCRKNDPSDITPPGPDAPGNPVPN